MEGLRTRPASTSSMPTQRQTRPSTCLERNLILAPEGRPALIYARAESPRVYPNGSGIQKQSNSSGQASVFPAATPNISNAPPTEKELIARESTKPNPEGSNSSLFKTDAKKKDVVIHVYDENRNAKRDFYCKQYLLLREMKFFSYLAERAATSNQVDIDVHCDIEVFEWLMMFITRQRPALEPRSVVSILISSNFLQMDSLQDVCLQYIHDRINEIIRVPIDLNCISKPLLSRLSALFTLSELDLIVDPKDKLTSKLHMHKISDLMIPSNETKLFSHTEQIFAALSTPPSMPPASENSQPSETNPIENTKVLFRRCKLCSKVYPKHEESRLVCEDAVFMTNARGEIICTHDADDEFSFNAWVADLVINGLEWRQVLWRIWGLLQFADCTSCKKRFALCEYSTCRRHTDEAIFPQSFRSSEKTSDLHKGRYLCCGEPVYKFNPFQASKGCSLTQHTFSDEWKESATYHIFESHFNLVVNAFPETLTADAQKDGTTVLISDVRCFRILGTWTEEMYHHTDDMHVEYSITAPQGFIAADAKAPHPAPVRTVPKNLEIYLQREEDANRMQSMTRQCLSLRSVHNQ
ncbi:hypothetical protein BJ741DRAFT_598090 [Chytriomyces cf. hyalinus JEL632]|nr:hypothetical protein BJ741DRAFT_598090 [Chytriomyces cf. hyalinus JEL632]